MRRFALGLGCLMSLSGSHGGAAKTRAPQHAPSLGPKPIALGRGRVALLGPAGVLVQPFAGAPVTIAEPRAAAVGSASDGSVVVVGAARVCLLAADSNEPACHPRPPLL